MHALGDGSPGGGVGWYVKVEDPSRVPHHAQIVTGDCKLVRMVPFVATVQYEIFVMSANALKTFVVDSFH